MSVFEDGSYGSLAGIALIGKVLAGRCSMRYVRAAVGSGKIPEGKTPKTMTDSAGYVMDAQISGVSNPVDGECQVTVQIKSDNVASGFYATNIVLFAEDPDLGQVPYTYLSLENEPEWIRPASSIVGKLATFDIIAAVGDVDKVTAVIDPESIATAGLVEQAISDHNADENAHKRTIEAVANKVVADSFADGTAKSETVAIVQDMISSGEISTGAFHKVIDSRLTPQNWRSDPNPKNGFIFYYDIADTDATAGLVPMVVVNENSRETAAKCELSFNAETIEGGIRVKCVTKPTENIDVTAFLFSGGAGGAAGVFTLPVATNTRLGGVKIGDGVDVTHDGLLSADAETDANVATMLREVFGDTI